MPQHFYLGRENRHTTLAVFVALPGFGVVSARREVGAYGAELDGYELLDGVWSCVMLSPIINLVIRLHRPLDCSTPCLSCSLHMPSLSASHKLAPLWEELYPQARAG